MSARPSEVRVRRLRVGDAGTVTGLLRQLGYQADETEVRDRIQAWTADDRGALFGAIVEDALAGCTAIYVVPFFERPGSRARLVALVVDERYRRHGLATALVEHAREFARSCGAVEIEVTSRRERTCADRFYTRLGFPEVSDRSRRYLADV